jgi:pimeloyl-ACP methyl ester carboxylesterase
MHGSTAYSKVVGTTLLLLLLTGTAGQAQEGNRKAVKRSKPFTLLEQGSFYVGGSIEFRQQTSTTPNDTRFGPGDIALNQMYVQYQIPKDQKYRYPIVLMHGGGHTAKVFETTPDGREGWYTSFMRRGFSPYAVDAPNRGRSGWEPTQRFLVTLGLAAPSTLEAANIYSKQAAWTAFRVGPTYGERYPQQQFPSEFYDQYIKQSVPAYRDATQNPKIAADLVALIDEIGPCILLGWSTGGSNVLNAAAQRPNLVKGLIAIEPAGAFNVNAVATVPMFLIQGDNSSADGVNNIAAQVNALGGDATALWLPDAGIFGNGHTMMAELNNEQIADLIESWVGQHVRGVRGAYQN